jgi:hypothetical protein
MLDKRSRQHDSPTWKTGLSGGGPVERRDAKGDAVQRPAHSIALQYQRTGVNSLPQRTGNSCGKPGHLHRVMRCRSARPVENSKGHKELAVWLVEAHRCSMITICLFLKPSRMILFSKNHPSPVCSPPPPYARPDAAWRRRQAFSRFGCGSSMILPPRYPMRPHSFTTRKPGTTGKKRPPFLHRASENEIEGRHGKIEKSKIIHFGAWRTCLLPAPGRR